MANNRAKPTSASASWRDVLPVHPACAMFDPLPPDELRALGRDIKKTGLTSPIVLWRATADAQRQLLDGRNRLDAIEAAIGRPVHVDDEEIWLDSDDNVKWRDSGVTIIGPPFDPYAYVISANLHRRHLTVEQKRDLIAKLLAADPSRSDRSIAETVKASPTFVGKVRAEKEATGDVSTVDTRRDSRGRRQPAKKPPKCPPEPIDESQAAANGEGIDADAPMLGILLKAWDRAPEPVRQKFMARVGLIPDPLAIPPSLDRRTSEAAS